MAGSERLEVDYQNFIKVIEEAANVEREKVRQRLDALKASAAEIGAAVEFSS